MQLLQRKLTLPELKNIDLKIGKNKVQQLAQTAQQLPVAISMSHHEGWLKLSSELSPPLKTLFLAKSHKEKATIANQPCLKLTKKIDLSSLGSTTKLTWLSHFNQPALSPDDIRKTWLHSFSFREEDQEHGIAGLRPPQIGALHAICAHYSTKQRSLPATVVLPTGTGKTEVMLAALISRRPKKLLVLVPSAALRTQIAEKFRSLGKLYELGLIKHTVQRPSVACIEKHIHSTKESRELFQHANVVVAIPTSLKSMKPSVVATLCDIATDLFVDEAHHIKAPSWESIRNHFSNKPVIQFTATPFREDGKPLDGKIIYNYSMKEAQQAGYFKPINLCPIEEYHDDNVDRTIASKAIEILRSDRGKGLDHILMARVRATETANKLLSIYEELAPDLSPIVMHSKQSKSKELLEKLLTGKSQIVICVNMLGEGFDLPSLKVAAIHEIHKSLSITLQFIGRFTRESTSLNLGEASVVVNVADQNVDKSLQELYAQDADWDSILCTLSENKISHEIGLQALVDNLKKQGELHKQIALWNLRPGFTTTLFSLPDATRWVPLNYTEKLPKNSAFWHAYSRLDNILIILATQEGSVKFGRFSELQNIAHHLLIAKHNPELNALFIYASDYKWFNVERIASAISGDSAKLLTGPQIFNVFNNIKYPLVKNVGGMPTNSFGAISFTQYLGANVTEGLAQIEQTQLTLSNLSAIGYNAGERVIWGGSQKKGKIWSVASGSIHEWASWAATAWEKVNSGPVDEENITKGFLRPKPLKEKYSKFACSISWGEEVQARAHKDSYIHFGETKEPFYFVDLSITDPENNQPYLIELSSDQCSAKFNFDIKPKGCFCEQTSGPPVQISRNGSSSEDILSVIKRDPWMIQYADCSYSYGNYHIQPSIKSTLFDAQKIKTHEWECDITQESMGKQNNLNTVQGEMFKLIQEEYDVIINDDGKNEIADLVCLNKNSENISLHLIHCKYSSKPKTGARLNDFYELCGQAQKSSKWKHYGLPEIYQHITRREFAWRKENTSRFLKGSLQDLASMKSYARKRPITLKVTLVQPGLNISEADEGILSLLGTTELYLMNSAAAKLEVLCS